MFYRFKSKLATQDRLEAFPVPTPGIDKNSFGPWIKQYEERFKVIKENSATMHCTVYCAPKFDDKPYGMSLRFHEGKESEWLPDIWGVAGYLIASERFRQVVETVDDFGHEFIPITWIDHQERTVETTYPYYWFNPRRFLRIMPGEQQAENLNFIPIPGEEDFISRVLETPSLREKIEKIPLWRHYGLEGAAGRNSQARMVMYFNQAFVNSARKAGITGMDEYSVPYGDNEESLVGI